MPQSPLILTLLHRELDAVRRSVEVYPDEASFWAVPGGLPNPGGTLVLHIAGNLQHYLGAVLGGTGYVRDRDAEFSRRDVPRDELLAEIDAAREAITAGLAGITPERLAAPYPELVAGRQVATLDYLTHLLAHLAYHLGQLDYHRRVVTGDRTGIGAVPQAALPPLTTSQEWPAHAATRP